METLGYRFANSHKQYHLAPSQLRVDSATFWLPQPFSMGC
jgi:hypothetical protein